MPRAAEEANGLIRWLRPDYQSPASLTVQTSSADFDTASEGKAKSKAKGKAVVGGERPTARERWPEALPQQIDALLRLPNMAPVPQTLDALAAQIQGSTKASLVNRHLPALLESLVMLGRVQKLAGGYQLLA